MRLALKFGIVTAIFAIAGLPMPSSAAFIDGNTLYEWCSYPNDETAKYYQYSAFCGGYIDGVMDDGADNGWLGKAACPPPNVTNKQTQDIITKFLRDGPEQRHFTASTLIGVAMFLAFPCKDK